MDYSNANRRSFLLGVAAAAASAGYFSGGLRFPAAKAAQAQGGRKIVMVGGKRVKVVDIHAHCVIPKVADVLKGTDVKGQFPANQILGPGRMAAITEGNAVARIADRYRRGGVLSRLAGTDGLA